MMAHGETLGLLCIGADQFADRNKEFPEIQLIRALAENSSLALANLKLREVLRSQSVRDPLTNLYNRRYMEEFLDGQLSRAVRKKSSLALMMLDVDHFKTFNDTFGHDAGDMVLRTLGSILTTKLRKEDLFADSEARSLQLFSRMRPRSLLYRVRSSSALQFGKPLWCFTNSPCLLSRSRWALQYSRRTARHANHC